MLVTATSAVRFSPKAHGTMLIVAVPAAPAPPISCVPMKAVCAVASPMRKLFRPVASAFRPSERPMATTVAKFRRSNDAAASEASALLPPPAEPVR